MPTPSENHCTNLNLGLSVAVSDSRVLVNMLK